jgi:hypothetical protein
VLVGAGADAALDGGDDHAVLGGAGLADELRVARDFLERLGVVVPEVGESVADLARRPERERLEHHHVGMARQHRDQDVREELVDVGEQPVQPALGRRHRGELLDAAEGIGDGYVRIAPESANGLRRSAPRSNSSSNQKIRGC